MLPEVPCVFGAGAQVLAASRQSEERGVKCEEEPCGQQGERRTRKGGGAPATGAEIPLQAVGRSQEEQPLERATPQQVSTLPATQDAALEHVGIS